MTSKEITNEQTMIYKTLYRKLKIEQHSIEKRDELSH